VQSVNAVIETVAGNGQLPSPSCSNNNVDAKTACLDSPFGIATAPDGTYYFADTHQNRIFRVTTNGILNVIAGTGTCGSSGDGGQATNAQICGPEGIALSRDGSLYFADFVITGSGVSGRAASLPLSRATAWQARAATADRRRRLK